MSTKAERKRQEKIRRTAGIILKAVLAAACLATGIIYYVQQSKVTEDFDDVYSVNKPESDKGSDTVKKSEIGKGSEANKKSGTDKSGEADKKSGTDKGGEAGNKSGTDKGGETDKKSGIDKGGETGNKSGTENDGEPVSQNDVFQKDGDSTVIDNPDNIASGSEVVADDGKIDINKAGVNELCKLNGIGEKRAADIIEYRNSHGDFERIEDIMKVKGIKHGIFSKIRDDIKVS